MTIQKLVIEIKKNSKLSEQCQLIVQNDRVANVPMYMYQMQGSHIMSHILKLNTSGDVSGLKHMDGYPNASTEILCYIVPNNIHI